MCAPAPFQHALVASMPDIDLKPYQDEYRQKRDMLVERLHPAFHLSKPEGAFYALMGLKTDRPDMELVEALIRDHGVAAMPGAYTATELHRAWRAGAQLQKLFPAPANGPEYAAMLRGPLPKLRLVPTSGVTPENVAEWLAAGVYAVGFVASLFVAEELRAGRFDAVEERARTCLRAARAAARPAAVESLVPAREVTA